jgi:hypothetical protein
VNNSGYLAGKTTDESGKSAANVVTGVLKNGETLSEK